MICFFNGQDSQPIQPLLPHAFPQVGLNEFQFGKGSLGCCPVTDVRNNSSTVHTTKGEYYVIHNQHLGKLGDSGLLSNLCSETGPECYELCRKRYCYVPVVVVRQTFCLVI